jgi:hypothetical protein
MSEESNKTPKPHGWRPWGDHPVVVIVAVFSALISVCSLCGDKVYNLFNPSVYNLYNSNKEQSNSNQALNTKTILPENKKPSDREIEVNTPLQNDVYTKADSSKAQVPSDDEMQDIVKKTLLDFNNALQKEDFTDFHKTISKIWQMQITPGKFKETFQKFIKGETDLSPISSMLAKFTRGPEISKGFGINKLEVKGEYATSPQKTKFELKYIAEGKEWKLTGLTLYTNIKK